MSFQQTIRREAKRQGLSGYAIGKRSGVPIRTVQAYLAGDCDLMGERIAKIAAALGLGLRPTRQRKGRAE
jgi:transcriptional regulator with XRE-family HTH domain